MINGDHQGSSALGGKNVYLVTPPNKKQQVAEYHYSTPNQFNNNTAIAATDNLPNKRYQPSTNTNADFTRPSRYKVEEEGQSKNSGMLHSNEVNPFCI